MYRLSTQVHLVPAGRPSRLTDPEGPASGRFLRAEMVGKFLTIEAMRETLLIPAAWKRSVIPLADEAMINVLLASLSWRARAVFHNIEQERVVEDFEEL